MPADAFRANRLAQTKINPRRTHFPAEGSRYDEQAHDTCPRRPLREVVGDIDRDILRLLLRRHNLLARMHNSKGFLDPAEEKALRDPGRPPSPE